MKSANFERYSNFGAKLVGPPASVLSRAPDSRPNLASVRSLFAHWEDNSSAAPAHVDPVVSFARELASMLSADAICLSWHGSARDDEAHFLTPPHVDPESEALLRAASLAHRGATDGPSWRASDLGNLMRFDVAGENGHVALIALFHPCGEDLAAQRAISQWLPMIQAFLSLWIEQHETKVHASALTAALNKGGAATIITDGSARVLFANDSASEMLDRRDGMCRNGALLGGNRLADTLRLRGAIEHAMQRDPIDAETSPVIAMVRSSGRPLLVAVVAADRDWAEKYEQAVILYVFDPDLDIHLLAEPACSFYGLSPVETKLTCLLADGHSLTDAAKAMRIQEQTARSYLKQVFSKTATNRQAELVQLMLKSLVRTTSRCVTRFV